MTIQVSHAHKIWYEMEWVISGVPSKPRQTSEMLAKSPKLDIWTGFESTDRNNILQFIIIRKSNQIGLNHGVV